MERGVWNNTTLTWDQWGDDWASDTVVPMFASVSPSAWGAYPTVATGWKVGDFVRNTAEPLSLSGWLCTVAGNPGTWVAVNTIMNMTGTARDNLSTPVEGMVIYNTSTHKLNVRVAAGWEAVTSA